MRRVFHPETNGVKASPHRHKWMLSHGAPADPSDPWNSHAAPVSPRQNGQHRWQKIRTNNPLERIMREIRRRTRVVGAFPDGQSCLNLAAARLRYIVGTAWSTKCYMNMRPLYQPQLMQTEAVA